MMSSASRVGILLVFAAMAAAPVHADWAVGGEGGYFGMSNAPDSAKAIFGGSSGGGTYGGFVRFGLGESFFVGAHGRYFSKTGERVFVAAPGSQVFRLGHPLTVREIPVYAEVGYRFLRGRSIAPYFSAGAGATSYKETSDVAGLIETSSTTKPSFHFAFGADYGRGALRFGAEVGYSLVPSTIGEAGVSKVYGETDVGGFTLLGRLSFGSSAP